MSAVVPPEHPWQQAIEGWRRTRSPRYAAIVDALSAREAERPIVGASRRKADAEAWDALEAKGDPADLPRLIAAVGGTQSPAAIGRIERLVRRDDPRLVTGLLGMIEKPPYTGGSSKKFWQTVIATLAASNDVRAHDAMLALSKRYETINGTFMGEWIAGAMARAAAKMKVVRALPAGELAVLEALEVAVLGGVPRPAEPSRAPRTLADLFAQIAAAPDDDGARMVYADALLERDASELDRARGELIHMQLARAADRATPADADRERAMIERGVLDELAVPLGAACEAVTFERGFPVAAQLKAKGLAQVADAVEWGTLRRISGLDEAPIKPLLALFETGRLRHVTQVAGLTAARFDKLVKYGAGWTNVELTRDRLAPDSLTKLPALRTLTVYGNDVLHSQWLRGAPEVTELTSWSDAPAFTAHMISPLAKLRSLTLWRRVPPVLERVETLRAPLESLGLNAPLAVVAAWFAVLPHVRALTLYDDDVLRTDGEFDWQAFGALLATPRLETLTVERSRGSFTARLDRTSNGWTLTLPCADRWVGFYEQLVELPDHLEPLGVTRVILEPEAPRHYAEPFSDVRGVTLAQIAEAWSPVPVELREVLRWPGEAPGEAWSRMSRHHPPVR